MRGGGEQTLLIHGSLMRGERGGTTGHRDCVTDDAVS